ncbi:ethanolamine ammonia-lyase subunit EutC [Ferruginibacter sp. SUN106]|uniref:ethanolamine ammonia-lyase subunit EutC n=1 Tax=Ferruginibacter sp. SUN106 TaxID=2978348 RepID=UPI003D363614
MNIQQYTRGDSWQSLKKFTAARIALGSTGVAIPLKELLQFRLAHAHARDAVFSQLNKDVLAEGLKQLQLPFTVLHSKAQNRNEYLQQPGFGRKLNHLSAQQLQHTGTACDIAIIIADGLSATAVNNHALPLLQLLIPLLKQSKFLLAPVNIAEQARVAIGDEVGVLCKAKFSIILIGERPGLSSPDSMGAYLTYAPAVGLTDESRNCISNIRPQGMNYTIAAEKIYYLIKEAFRLQYSGVALKDNAGLLG